MVFGRLIRDWWTGPVDYDAQVQYFTKRSTAEAIRMVIAVGAVAVAVISQVVLLPSADTLASRVAAVAFAALAISWGCVWVFRPWPSRVMSLLFVISVDIGIAAVALLDASWLTGLFGFNAFSLISVYLMFFDGPKVLAWHSVWMLISTMAFAVRFSLDAQVDGGVLTAQTFAAMVPVLASPLGIQLGIWTLRNDANESVTDPLTGLLNRRGLHLHMRALISDHTAARSEVAVMVVDLDRFKDINDSFGHTVGDEVLIRSARRIKSAVTETALVARVGGEEFVIVDLIEAGHQPCDGDPIRSAVAAPADHMITASIGVTSVALADIALRGVDPAVVLDTIIARADGAMYNAKRNGGNATIHIPAAATGS